MPAPSIYRLSSLLVLFAALSYCSPQTTGPATTATTPATPAPATATATQNNPSDDELSTCRKFSDAADPDEAETNYVIYRQMMKAGDTKGARKVWRQVYANSPAADGKRATVFTDGVAFYNLLIRENPAQTEAYGDTILQLYQEARDCYPGDGYMTAMQGFDGYYTYKGSMTDDKVYELFKESIDIDGPEELQYFVINPMSSLVVSRFREGKIDEAEAKEVTDALLARLEKGLAECNGEQCEAWNAIEAYAPETLRFFETVRGFYDCQYYVDQYYADFQANPTDCDVITLTYGRLRFGECGEDLPEYQAVRTAYQENCAVVTSSTPSTLRQAYDALQEGNSDEAIRLFEQAAEETDDAERKGRYYLTAAKIYYGNKRNFSQARKYARLSAEANPNSGEPYMLIGTLYASSGPLCGPGTGFDSQVVTWPAIDKWQQAKRIDSSVAARANELINRYSQYMPSKSDIFQRGISEGDSFTVGCWIQETTRVRTP